MRVQRLLLVVIFGAVLALGTASDAFSGSIADFTPCPKSSSSIDLVCPLGTTGQPYSIKFRGDEDPICAPGDDKWYASNGTVPPGLSLAENGVLSGTPTQAGTFSFWLLLRLPDYFNGSSGCSSRDNSEEHVSITIVEGLAKLTLGPESTTPGTRGQPYSLQMTATVPDAKTWSVNSGALPPGLALDTNTGLISGTPTTSGQFDFQILAKMNGDARSDTKGLGIVVRDPLAITGSQPFSSSRRAVGEVTAPFDALLIASGGAETYTWSLSSGSLPPGLLFAEGAISGTPRVAGTYTFVVTATDSEGRVANYPSRIAVAMKLSVKMTRLRPGKVGKLYAARLATLGGIKPASWAVLRGALPRGVRFNRATGQLYGTPKKKGRFPVMFEATDSLGVFAVKKLTIVIARASKPTK